MKTKNGNESYEEKIGTENDSDRHVFAWNGNAEELREENWLPSGRFWSWGWEIAWERKWNERESEESECGILGFVMCLQIAWNGKWVLGRKKKYGNEMKRNGN